MFLPRLISFSQVLSLGSLTVIICLNNFSFSEQGHWFLLFYRYYLFSFYRAKLGFLLDILFLLIENFLLFWNELWKIDNRLMCTLTNITFTVFQFVWIFCGNSVESWVTAVAQLLILYYKTQVIFIFLLWFSRGLDPVLLCVWGNKRSILDYHLLSDVMLVSVRIWRICYFFLLRGRTLTFLSTDPWIRLLLILH